MAIINTPYSQSLKILCGAGNWLTDDVRIALLSSGYTFDAAHTLFDNEANNATDPSHSELANGTGYTTGGEVLGTKSLDDNMIDAASVTFPFAAEKVFRQGIIYIHDTVDTIVNPVLFHVLFDDTAGGTDITVPSISYVINWSVNGIASLSVAASA